MEMVFVKLLHMGIQASIAVGVILLVRELFKLMKVPKKYAYILWVIPFIRLVCPIDIESPFSIMPDMTELNIAESMENIQSETEISDEIMSDMSLINASASYENANIKEESLTYAEYNVKEEQLVDDIQMSEEYDVEDKIQMTEGQPVTDVSQITDEQQSEAVIDSMLVVQNQNMAESDNADNIVVDYSTYPMSDELTDITIVPVDIQGKDTTAVSKIKPIEIISIVWFVVMVGIVIYSAVTLIILKRKLSVKAPISNDVYAIDCIDTAFVLGISNPKIYVPSYIDEKDLEYVVAHERYHIRRLDYIIKPLAYFIGVLHWYNPIVWLSYHMLVKDMEMSCDEAVLGNLGIDNKKNYAKALLKLSVGRHYALSIPTAFAEGSTKGRVKNIMKIKKPLILVAVIAVAVIGVLGVTLLTNPKEATDTLTVEEKPELACGRYSMVLPEREDEISSMKPPYGEEYIFVPYVEIFEDGTAIFCYNPLYYFYPYVESGYVFDGTALTMTTEGGRTYTFNVSEDGSLFFDDAASYDMRIPDDIYLTQIKDKSQFVLDENAEPDYMEKYVAYITEAQINDFDIGTLFIEEVDYNNVNVSEDIRLGSDGVILDYADENIIIFHGYAGLFVYNRNTMQVQDSINLAELGLDKTQGDETCEIFVDGNGDYVYFRSLKNGEIVIEEFYDEATGVKMEDDVLYRYHVEARNLVKGPDSSVFINAERMENVEVTEECIENIEYSQGVYSSSCVEVSDGVYGYLICSTDLWKDICYVESDMVYMMYDEEYFSKQAEIQALIQEAEAQAESAQSNLDALVADSLYQEIISKYSIALYQGWSVEEMEQEGLCPYADKYSLYDVNMDGVEELLIGKKTPAGIDYDLYDIYTVENGELIQVTDGAETDSYKIYETGIIGYQNENYSTSNHPIEFANYYLINGVLYDITALGEEEITSWGSSNDNNGFMDASYVGDYAMIELEFTRFE